MKNTLKLALAVLFCIVLCLGIGASAWAENCTITFDPNGGYGTMEPQVVTDGGTVTLKANAYYRTNYIFTGWNTKADGSGSAYADREFINIYNFGQTVTLYAQWETAIVFDKNHPEALGYMGPQAIKLGTTVILDPNGYTLQNHVFDRWSDTSDGRGMSWADEGDYYADTSRTLYAQWVKTHYAVNYDKNGGGGSMSSTNALKNTLATVKWNEFNAPNSSMIFAEWNTDPNGWGDRYLPGENIGSDDIPSDITLYAVWRDKLQIWIYPGDAEGEAGSWDVPRDTPVTLPRPTEFGFAAPEGQIFAGWMIDGDLYRAGDEYVFDTPRTVTAQWAKQIKVIFDANGGTPASPRKVQLIPQGISTNLAKMEKIGYTRSGYRFLGWALGAGADMPKTGWEVENEPLIVAFSSDTTLYAVWEQLDFEGIVTIAGSVSDMAEKGLVGETLTADVNGEKEFFDYKYQWLRDGVEIEGATKQTYTVTPDDFEHRITCRVTAEDAKGEKTKLSINYKYIELDAIEKTIDIVDNLPEDEDDFLYGLTNGMKYSFNSTDTKDREYVDDKLITINGVKAFPFFKQGTYRFYDTEGTLEQGSMIAIVEVRNWWSLSYRVTTSSSSSSSSSSGSGTVRMYNGGTQLTATSKIVDKSGNVIIQGTGTTSWLVRDGANTDLKIVVSPSSGSYGHVSLNGSSYSSLGSGEKTITVSPMDAPRHYELVFSREANYPPVPIAAIDEENFPDPAFRQYVSSRFDLNRDGALSDTEMESVTTISCTSLSIESLSGIEYFTKLQTLNCANNYLTELKLDTLTSLTALYCSNNYLEELNPENCPSLLTLICFGNMLNTLDVSACTSLRTVDCSSNMLTVLNLGEKSALVSLQCSDNIIGAMDLSGCTALKSLSCSNNNKLTGVIIPEGLTRIGNAAFSGCTRLKSITVPASVIRIDENAFNNCTSLSNIALPSGLSVIGNAAFAGCGKLTDVYYVGTQEQWNEISILDANEPLLSAVLHCIAPDLTLPAALTAIESEAFAGGSFASVYIPAGVTSIAPDAFGNRTGLTIIGVPGSAAEDFARAHGFDFVPTA